MIDTEIHLFPELCLYAASQQLRICYVYRNDTLGCKGFFRFLRLRQHELIPLRNRIIAVHAGALSHLMQHFRQGIAGSYAVSVRALMNQNIGIFTLFQPLGSFFQIPLLHLHHSSSSTDDSGASVTGCICCNFSLIAALCAIESSATKCSAGHFRIFSRWNSSRRI